MAEKGLITKQMESEAAQWLDDKIIKGGIWDTIDGMAFKLVISQLDDNFGEKVPEPFKSQIAAMLVDIFEENDKQAALYKATELADSLIDIPYIEDDTEKLIFRGFAEIVGAVLANMNILPKE